MCGFAGFFRGGRPGRGEADADLGRAMGRAIRHRGPDGEGAWTDAEAGITLSHRRLAIIDVTPTGAQPMASASGRYMIAFNGEIYNYADLRDMLEGSGQAPNWRGSSDTEVLLAAFEAWGVEQTLARANGMFAIGLWDRADRRLTLARDRIGEKPLYYGWQGIGEERALLFGSDLAALRAHPAFDAPLDPASVGAYMRASLVPAPRSIFTGIAKLDAGCFAQWTAGSEEPVIRRYWDLAAVIGAGVADPFKGTAEAAVDETERLLSAAVKRQMVADVPLGAFLSGGIDSSTVVALMQAQSASPVRTFTIGFEDKDFDEAPHARAVADHLGTDHTELRISAQDLLDTVPLLPSIYSEPFADSSQVPTFLVSRLAREHVTVALSGDAGDELFGGYNRYLFTNRMWSVLRTVPVPLRRAAGNALATVSPDRWDSLGGTVARGRFRQFGDKIHKGAALLGSRDADAVYDALVTLPRMDEVGPAAPVPTADRTAALGLDAVSRMMSRDMLAYLPDDILVKVDRAAMACSLETRVPMLDADVIAHAWCLPIGIKVRGGQGKWPLRQILQRHVPADLFDRPKMGFGIPIASWLRGPLRDWAESLLSRDAVATSGLLDQGEIDRLWAEHQGGSRNWAPQLWTLLMFQAWLLQPINKQ